MEFKKAVKEQAKLRVAWEGPAGSGKTFSSLLMAKILGGKTGLIDSEHGSASKYADLFDFDTVSPSEFSIDSYIKMMKEAAAAGYDNLITDSLSHYWMGVGGALEEVDMKGGNNKFSNGWKVVSPKQQRMVDSILAYPGHFIGTMRTKTDWVIEKNTEGKMVPRKVGLATVQRDDFDFHFDVVARLSDDGIVNITKTRCPALKGQAYRLEEVDKMTAILKAWVSSGVVPQPRMVPDISPAEAMEIAIREATTEAQLTAVALKIKGQPFAETLKPAYAAKLQELRHG